MSAFLMGSGWFCEEKQVRRLDNWWQDRHGVGRGQLCPPKWANQPIWPTQVGGQVGQPRPTYVTCAPHSTNAQPDLGRPVGQGTNSFFSSSLDLQIDFGQERAGGATIILSLDNMGSQNYDGKIDMMVVTMMPMIRQ